MKSHETTTQPEARPADKKEIITLLTEELRGIESTRTEFLDYVNRQLAVFDGGIRTLERLIKIQQDAADERGASEQKDSRPGKKDDKPEKTDKRTGKMAQ